MKGIEPLFSRHLRTRLRKLLKQRPNIFGNRNFLARIDDPDSGIVMVVFTTQPAFQFYTDNVANTVNGKKGHVYGNHNAISIETEHYPDAPSHPNFPSTEVTPDKPLHEITEYRFSSK